VNVINLPKHRGAGAARNAGVEASRGPLIAFLDDDDEWAPRKIERQVRLLLDADEDVAGVETGFEMWSKGRLVHRYLPLRDRDLQTAVLAGPCIVTSTVLLRRSALESVGGFDPRLVRTEDWDLWVRLVDRYRITSLPEIHVRRSGFPRSPVEDLEYHRAMIARLEGRIAARSRTERSRIRAQHAFREAIALARLGRSGEARARLWRAWLLDPSRVRPLLHLLRTFMGERAWAIGARIGRAAGRFLRMDGRWDPFLYRW
jgi:glycosyltransferase involved in cell wall biosynthesis